MEMLKSLKVLEDYFVDEPKPILTAETLQVCLLREVLDYTILRTEESRELNTVMTPTSVTDPTPMQRVAFFGSKQKAVESRRLEVLLRTAAQVHKIPIDECYLKDHLCLRCPRCVLFGGTFASVQKPDEGHKVANIKHRISYSTAFSLAPFEEIHEAITQNAINDSTILTERALFPRHSVRPASLFVSVVSLQCITWKEFVLALKAIMSAHQYGAETRISGDMRNQVIGIAAGWEEIITPLELTLELNEAMGQTSELDATLVKPILDRYATQAANVKRVKVLSPNEVEVLLEEVRNSDLSREFVDSAYRDAIRFREQQGDKKAVWPKK